MGKDVALVWSITIAANFLSSYQTTSLCVLSSIEFQRVLINNEGEQRVRLFNVLYRAQTSASEHYIFKKYNFYRKEKPSILHRNVCQNTEEYSILFFSQVCHRKRQGKRPSHIWHSHELELHQRSQKTQTRHCGGHWLLLPDFEREYSLSSFYKWWKARIATSLSFFSWWRTHIKIVAFRMWSRHLYVLSCWVILIDITRWKTL